MDDAETISAFESLAANKMHGCKTEHKIVLCRSINNLSSRNLLTYTTEISRVNFLRLSEVLEISSFDKKAFCKDYPNEKERVIASRELLSNYILKRTYTEVKDELPLAPVEKVAIKFMSVYKLGQDITPCRSYRATTDLLSRHSPKILQTSGCTEF